MRAAPALCVPGLLSATSAGGAPGEKSSERRSVAQRSVGSEQFLVGTAPGAGGRRGLPSASQDGGVGVSRVAIGVGVAGSTASLAGTLVHWAACVRTVSVWVCVAVGEGGRGSAVPTAECCVFWGRPC